MVDEKRILFALGDIKAIFEQMKTWFLIQFADGFERMDAHYYRLGGDLGEYFVFYDYDDNEVGRVLFKAIHSLRRMIYPEIP